MADEAGSTLRLKKTVARLDRVISARLLRIPTNLAPRLVNISDPAVIEGIFRTEIYAALDEIANCEPTPGELNG